jgi:hypothetical protein
MLNTEVIFECLRPLLALAHRQQAEVERLRKTLEIVRDDFDCDNDAHRHGTACRCCIAGAALDGETTP